MPEYSSQAIKFMSTEKILEVSYGEVTSFETLDFSYKVPKPFPGGLLCEKIFGPFNDYECWCGALRFKKHHGKVCGKCGVLSAKSSVRMHRMGHIMLPQPALNPLAVQSIQHLFHLSKADTQEILAMERYCGWIVDQFGPFVIQQPNGSHVRARFSHAEKEDKDHTSTTAWQLYDVVNKIDMPATGEVNQSPFIQLLREHDFHPRTYFLQALPVLPAGYRDPQWLDNGLMVLNEINNLYIYIMEMKNRAKTLHEFGDLRTIMRCESMVMQIVVNELFHGTKKSEEEKNTGLGFPGLLSLFKSKQGIFRSNLLGKRVDYSGRSAIVVGPDLQIDEVGIPFEMAYELLKVHIIGYLHKRLKMTKRDAIKAHKRRTSDAIEACGLLAPTKRVILNRQPTLHRHGAMSYQMKLHSGRAVRLHPMACAGFNADFDGDCMAVHLPTNPETQREAAEKMSPVANLLNPMNGEPILLPAHEAVVGLHLMTKFSSKTPTHVASIDKAIQLHELGVLHVSDPVVIHYKGQQRETCVGRLLIEQILPTRISQPLTKSGIQKIVSEAYDTVPHKVLVTALDKLKDLANKYVTQAGFSLGAFDIKTPSRKYSIIAETLDYISNIKAQVAAESIDEDTGYELTVRKWMEVVSQLQDEQLQEAGPDNPLTIMLNTGARVSRQQVGQLTTAKGMMANSKNRIMERPVLGSLREGLTTHEYFQTVYGSRKSMADKKFVTPKSGYLARKLVTVCRDLYIVAQDCGTSNGIELPLALTTGRTVLKQTSKDHGVVRSPVTCEARGGICQTCYGTDPATRSLVELKTPVGITAAQALTEPTTQLSLRTFHTSGVATLRAPDLIVKSIHGGTVSIREINDYLYAVSVDDFTYYIDQTSTLKVEEGDLIQPNDILAIYTNSELENQDIKSKLTLLELYYELAAHRIGEAIVAMREGTVELTPVGRSIRISIDGEPQGEISSRPVFVHNGEYVTTGQFLTHGEVNLRRVYARSGDLALAAQIFVTKVHSLYAEEGITPKVVHIEMVMRAISEIVDLTGARFNKDRTKIGLRRFDAGYPLLMPVTQIAARYPSWLKAMGFGYTNSNIEYAVTSFAKVYDLPTERIMIGSMPLIDVPHA